MLVKSLDEGKNSDDLQETFDTLIYMDFYIPSNLWTKHMVNQPLVCCPCILQIERNHLVTKQALIGDKGCLLLVCLVHPYLVVSRETSMKLSNL